MKKHCHLDTAPDQRYLRVRRAHGLGSLLPWRARWWLELHAFGRWHYVCSDNFQHNVESVWEHIVLTPDELFEKYHPTTAGVVQALRALHQGSWVS